MNYIPKGFPFNVTGNHRVDAGLCSDLIWRSKLTESNFESRLDLRNFHPYLL